jgi:hypothetical protein
MKTKVKKYFITYLSLVLILSNFSFATTLALCEMDGGKYQCCAEKNDMGKYGPTIRNVAYSCCENTVVELTNSNILEIIHNTPVNPLAHSDFINTNCGNTGIRPVKEYTLHFDLSHHPPNSEIPILNSSLLI